MKTSETRVRRTKSRNGSDFYLFIEIDGFELKFGLLGNKPYVTVADSMGGNSQCSLDCGDRPVRRALQLLPYEAWPEFARPLVTADMLNRQDVLPTDKA